MRPARYNRPGMAVEIRLIRADEAERLRTVRLAALADAPTAFGSTLADEQGQPAAFWRARAERSAAGQTAATFIAERDGRWVGTATGLLADGAPGGATLVGMWVDPAARRQGLGRALVEAVVAWARARGATQVDLHVTESNGAALALYRRCGFELTGERQPLAHTPSLLEVGMRRRLG